MKSNVANQIIEKAKEKGATMAGIASIELLKKTPSHEIINMKSGLEIIDFKGINWPRNAKSALIIAVSHPENKPKLDWWYFHSSSGNNILERIINELCIWIKEEFGIKSQEMPYDVKSGGIYLKDTAVLGGLGCIGKNNLLITPELGPRVRLRAMLLEEDLPSTGPISFDPCNGCGEYCKKDCPQNAFSKPIPLSSDLKLAALPGRDGLFSRAKCLIQMNKDIKDSKENCENYLQINSNRKKDFNKDAHYKYIKYCRKCELSCPIGK